MLILSIVAHDNCLQRQNKRFVILWNELYKTPEIIVLGCAFQLSMIASESSHCEAAFIVRLPL